MNLKMLYQEQLYTWGQLEFRPRSDAKQTSESEFEKVKQAATESRVTTRKQMIAHQKGCGVCQKNLAALRSDLHHGG
jgi:hypothetical protein